MDILQIIVFGLATWRISSLMVAEEGPFSVFWAIRDFFRTVILAPNVVDDILSCVWCTSIYAGAAWAIFFVLSPAVAFYVAIPFALSACAILLNLVVEKLKS